MKAFTTNIIIGLLSSFGTFLFMSLGNGHVESKTTEWNVPHISETETDGDHHSRNGQNCNYHVMNTEVGAVNFRPASDAFDIKSFLNSSESEHRQSLAIAMLLSGGSTIDLQAVKAAALSSSVTPHTRSMAILGLRDTGLIDESDLRKLAASHEAVAVRKAAIELIGVSPRTVQDSFLSQMLPSISAEQNPSIVAEILNLARKSEKFSAQLPVYLQIFSQSQSVANNREWIDFVACMDGAERHSRQCPYPASPTE